MTRFSVMYSFKSPVETEKPAYRKVDFDKP
jgi:hypothetical protein